MIPAHRLSRRSVSQLALESIPPVILAIDPGPKESAFVAYNAATGGIRNAGKQPNGWLLDQLRSGISDNVSIVVIEKVESFGMAVGAEVFETVFWSGRFAEAAEMDGREIHRIGRKAVKLALCQSMRAKDSNIRAALIDRYGGKEAAIGRKKSPGPLYGISGDVWSALAVAVAWSEQALGRAA